MPENRDFEEVSQEAEQSEIPHASQRSHREEYMYNVTAGANYCYYTANTQLLF